MRRRTERSATAVMLACACACGEGKDPTSSGPDAMAQFGFGGQAAIILMGAGGGINEIELVLDGTVLNKRSFDPANGELIILDHGADRLINRGNHRLSVRIVRQATNPATYAVQLYAVVVDLSTRASKVFSLPGGLVTRLISEGQSIDLEFSVGM